MEQWIRRKYVLATVVIATIWILQMGAMGCLLWNPESIGGTFLEMMYNQIYEVCLGPKTFVQ